MDRPRVHATLLVAGEGGGGPPPVREFWLLTVEPEPEPHFQESPGGTSTEAGTRPASRTAVHAHWVEVTFEPPQETPNRTRSRPYDLDGVLVGRGPVGELLGQEFLAAFPDAERILALQREADAERTRSDATRWDDATRRRIEDAERRLEDALYASPFPHLVVLVLLPSPHRDLLRRDFAALALPRGRLADASAPEGP